MNKISAGTIARTAVLLVTLANMILTTAGKNPLPFSDTEVFNYVSEAAAVIAAVIAWWKNNSFTAPAIAADEYKNQLKER